MKQTPEYPTGNRAEKWLRDLPRIYPNTISHVEAYLKNPEIDKPSLKPEGLLTKLKSNLVKILHDLPLLLSPYNAFFGGYMAFYVGPRPSENIW